MSHETTLPDYTNQLAAFHRAFAAELRAVVAALPLSPTMRVLDVGCGDGFYMALFAQRLVSPGSIVGLDVNAALLDLARKQPGLQQAACEFEFCLSELGTTTSLGGPCDFVWCAQSLYSLPDPVQAVRQMTAAVRPGGFVAILENDSLHQLLLPWPSELELVFRSAEFADFFRETERPSKFYVGRRLPNVLAEGGLEPLGFRTQCIDRQTPLDDDLQEFLQSYLERMAQRVAPHLSPALRNEFDALIDVDGDRYLLRLPHFTMSWLNVLAWGRRPLES